MTGTRSDTRTTAKGGRLKPSERSRRISVFHANPIRSYQFDATNNKATTRCHDARPIAPLASDENRSAILQVSQPQYRFDPMGTPQAGQLDTFPQEEKSAINHHVDDYDLLCLGNSLANQDQSPAASDMAGFQPLVLTDSNEELQAFPELNHETIAPSAPPPSGDEFNFDHVSYPSIQDTSSNPSQNWYHEGIDLNLHHDLPALSVISALEQPLTAFPVSQQLLPVDILADATNQPLEPVSASLSAVDIEPHSSTSPTAATSSCEPITDDILMALTEPFLMSWCLDEQSQSLHSATPWDDTAQSTHFWPDSFDFQNSLSTDYSSSYPVDSRFESQPEFS